MKNRTSIKSQCMLINLIKKAGPLINVKNLGKTKKLYCQSNYYNHREPTIMKMLNKKIDLKGQTKNN